MTTTVIVDTCGNVKRETVIDTRGTYEGSLDQEFLAGGKEDLSRGAQRSSSRRQCFAGVRRGQSEDPCGVRDSIIAGSYERAALTSSLAPLLRLQAPSEQRGSISLSVSDGPGDLNVTLADALRCRDTGDGRDTW